MVCKLEEELRLLMCEKEKMVGSLEVDLSVVHEELSLNEKKRFLS